MISYLILFRYESIPNEMRSYTQHSHRPERIINEKDSLRTYQTDTRAPGAVLSQYLFNQRWIWCMSPITSGTSDGNSISHIVGMIMRLACHICFK